MQRVHKTINTKSRKYCSVPQCSSYCTEKVSLHQFPLRDTKLCKMWKNMLKIKKPITKFMYVCSNHFLAGDFFINCKGPSTGKRKQPKLLKRTAIPSINIPKSLPKTESSENRNENYCTIASDFAKLGEQLDKFKNKKNWTHSINGIPVVTDNVFYKQSMKSQQFRSFENYIKQMENDLFKTQTESIGKELIEEIHLITIENIQLKSELSDLNHRLMFLEQKRS